MRPTLSATAAAILAAGAWLAASPLAVGASCECGYRDAATDALWTDATIVYFNETGMQQIVTPSVSPESIYGQSKAGESGDGQEAFTALGDFINPYEVDFGAKYRSAYSYNNTFADAKTPEQGLAMQISPANWRKHTVNSSQIITRRRDIQFGSFRAMIQHANTSGYGGAFQFSVAYNESEIINTGIYLGDLPENSTLRWSFSAAGADADPVKTNLTFLKQHGDPRSNNLTYLNTAGPVEHRMDWLSPKRVQFRNTGRNDTISFLAYEKGVNATNLPSTPAPVSFKTWANGEPSISQGPPMYEPLITRVLYVRFFYNSTLISRNEAFAESCAQTAVAVCDTEDYTLRDSTAFTTESLLRIMPVKEHFKVPIWGAVPTVFFTAVFIAIVIHGMFVNAGKAKQRKVDAASVGLLSDSASISSSKRPRSRQGLRPFGLQQSDDHSKKYLSTASINEETGEIPELYRDWVDSDSEYDSDEYDEAEVIQGQMAQAPRLSRINRLSGFFGNRRSILSTTKKRRHDSVRLSDIIGEGEKMEMTESTQNLVPSTVPSVPSMPVPSHARFASYRFGGPSVTDESVSESAARRSDPRASGHNNFAESSSEARQKEEERMARWQQGQEHPTIVNWQRRVGDDGGDVGRLARPVSMAPTHRLSIVPVQHSFVYMLIQRARNMIFVSESSGPMTSTGAKRIDYLDGMRGFACLGVSVAHFTLMFYHSISDGNKQEMHYVSMESFLRRVIAPIYINAGLLLGIFFILPSRTTSYLTRGGLASMADAVLRRLPRLALPTLGAALINYMLIDVGGYQWVRSLASLTWSTWAYYQNYDNVLQFVNSFITLWWAAPPDSPALLTTYATGVLWTIPLIVQGWWTCLLCALIAHEIKSAWKRFTFYFVCIFISWYANNWDMFFMGGLIIADLDANLNYRALSEKGIPIPFLHGVRVKGSLIAWLVFGASLTQQYFLFNDGAPGGDLNMVEYAIHPNFYNSKQHSQTPGEVRYRYQDPRVWSWFIVMSMFVLADLSTWFQTIWRLRVWAWLGRHSLGIFLLHGCVFWTWGAWLFILLMTHNVPYWASALITFLTSYVFLFASSVLFTSTFEYWAAMFSKACMRTASGGYGRKV